MGKNRAAAVAAAPVGINLLRRHPVHQFAR